MAIDFEAEAARHVAAVETAHQCDAPMKPEEELRILAATFRRVYEAGLRDGHGEHALTLALANDSRAWEVECSECGTIEDVSRLWAARELLRAKLLALAERWERRSEGMPDRWALMALTGAARELRAMLEGNE